MTVVNFRVDPETEALIGSLARPGETRSETIRRALWDAERLRRRERMHAEALGLAADDEDHAEAVDVLRDMGDLRAW